MRRSGFRRGERRRRQCESQCQGERPRSPPTKDVLLTHEVSPNRAPKKQTERITVKPAPQYQSIATERAVAPSTLNGMRQPSIDQEKNERVAMKAAIPRLPSRRRARQERYSACGSLSTPDYPSRALLRRSPARREVKFTPASRMNRKRQRAVSASQPDGRKSAPPAQWLRLRPQSLRKPPPAMRASSRVTSRRHYRPSSPPVPR